MPCVVRYHWDRVRYYNEFCNDGKSFCYWYVADVGGRRVWKLLHKDCECPCDCEDPERVGYNKHDLQVFSGECPNYLTPDRGLGDVSELPEDLQKEKLPSTHFVKTKCTYAIKDCKIRFRRGQYDNYYYPRHTYQYHDKLPCIYINNRLTCTDQKFVQCQDSPAYDLIYRIDPIPEEDFVRLNLWGEFPCTIEVRCAKGCDLTVENAYSYLIELETFFNNAGASSALSRFRIYNLRPENQALFRPFLPAPVQIDGPPIHIIFDRPYYGISRLNHVRYPPSRKSEPIPDSPSVGSCLYIITSTGEKYVYHTCSEGEFCPEIDWRRGQVRGCPEKDYIVTITNCEDSREESTNTTTTTPEPRFPFCAWESVPLQETFTYYEIEEGEPHGGGLSIKRVIREVRKARYYDIEVEGGLTGDGKFVAYDPYGFLIVSQKSCSFDVGTIEFLGGADAPYIAVGRIVNNYDGYVEAIYLKIRDWREDVPIPGGLIQQFWYEHNRRCDFIPWCSTGYETYFYNLEEHDKRALLPGLVTEIPLLGIMSPAAYAYGFSYLESVYDPSPGWSDGAIYFFNPALFAAGPDRYCKLTYDGSTWIATGTCDRCNVYIEMLNHIMKVCFRKKLHPFIEVASFPLPEPEAPYYSPYIHNYERVGAAFFEASRYTCLCTVGDVVRFLNQIWPFEIYLSCPLDLPDSDYLYFYRDNVSYGFLPCGANKAPAINIDLTKYGRYLIPCIESTDVECVPQEAQRIFWAFVPWVYQPCLCRERTSS